MTDPERHKDGDRNVIITRAVNDIEDIVNHYDPETDVPIDQGVWDRLDQMALDIERHAKEAIAAMSGTPAVKVKTLVWATVEGAKGFSGKGGPSTYYVMPCRNLDWRVYGISGDHDGAAQFPTLEKAKAKAEAHHREAVLSQIEVLDTPALKAADELAEAIEAYEKAESTAADTGREDDFYFVFECWDKVEAKKAAYNAARKDAPPPAPPKGD